MKAEILTSSSPMYFLNLSQFWVLARCLQVCQHLPSGLQMFLYVWGTSKQFGVWGPNRNWDNNLPTPLCICSTCPGFWVLALCSWMCQHLQVVWNIPMCLRNFKKDLVAGPLIGAEILTSPPQMFLLNLAQCWALALCLHVCQHLPSDLEIFLCVSETYKRYLVQGA